MSSAVRLFIAMLLSLGAAPAVGNAADPSIKILVRLVGTTTGVPSEILRKKVGEDKFSRIHETQDDGVLLIPTQCELGTYFRARPKEIIYLRPQDRPCSTEITFDVQTKEYVAELQQATDIAALKAVADKAGLGKLPENLESALASGNSALVAQISTEIHARLQQHPGVLNPEPYKVLAFDAGLGAIAGTAITFDTFAPAGRFVLSDDAVAHIRTYQQDNSIGESGRLDTRTLTSLTGIKTGDLYVGKLSTYGRF